MDFIWIACLQNSYLLNIRNKTISSDYHFNKHFFLLAGDSGRLIFIYLFIYLFKIGSWARDDSAAGFLIRMQHATAWPLNNLYVLTYTRCSGPQTGIREFSASVLLSCFINARRGQRKRIRKQVYMSCRGFSSAHRRAWTSSWMKFTCRLCTKARPSVNRVRTEKELIWIITILNCSTWESEMKVMLHLQFLCPQPESPASAASREYQGRHPSRSMWPQTHPPRGTWHDH